MGLFFSALAKSSKLLNISSGWDAHYPTPTGNSSTSRTLLVGADQSHLASRKTAYRRQGRDSDWPKVSQQRMQDRKLGLAASLPILPLAVSPLDELLSLKPLHQTGHSAPVSHPNILFSLPSISPGAGMKGGGKRGSEVQALALLEVLPYMQLFLTIVFGHGGHIGSPERLVLSRGAALIVESSAGSLAHHRKAMAGCWTRGSVCISLSFRADWTFGSTRTAKGMQSRGQAPTTRGAQGEQPHSTRAPPPLSWAHCRHYPSTTVPLVLSKSFLTQLQGAFPIVWRWQGNPTNALHQSPHCTV